MEVNFDIYEEKANNISLLHAPNTRSKGTLAAWCFFFGLSGVHGFMAGKIGTGLLILFFPILTLAFL